MDTENLEPDVMTDHQIRQEIGQIRRFRETLGDRLIELTTELLSRYPPQQVTLGFED